MMCFSLLQFCQSVIVVFGNFFVKQSRHENVFFVYFDVLMQNLKKPLYKLQNSIYYKKYYAHTTMKVSAPRPKFHVFN